MCHRPVILCHACEAERAGLERNELCFTLSGVYSPAKKIEDSKVPIALEKYLGSNPSVRKIRIHFDNDIAGRKAAQTLKTILPDSMKSLMSHQKQVRTSTIFFVCGWEFTIKKHTKGMKNDE